MPHCIQKVILVLLLLTGLASAQVTVTTFEGIDASNYASAGLSIDPNGAVGTKQFTEWTNAVYWAFDKVTGAPTTAAPILGDTPWRNSNMPDCYGPAGNVELLFDHLASRWIIGRRQVQNGPTYFYCIAVSNTDDMTSPSFAWYTYELPLHSILGQKQGDGKTYYPDYPKIGTWIDGYYVTIDIEDPDNFAEVGVIACAFDRTTMLTGGTMRTPQCFKDQPNSTQAFRGHSLEPADIEGTVAPPSGEPEYFVSIQNPAIGQSVSNNLNEWIFHVNWTTPTLSTFTIPPITLNITPYTPGCFNINNVIQTVCVPEPSSSQTGILIDSVGDRLMQRLAYRRFNSGANKYQSWLVSHAIQTGSAPLSQTGIRWYEARDNGTFNTGTIGTNNDGIYRFMPSIAQDKAGNMAAGYSASSPSLHPSIAMAYLNLQNRTLPTEIPLWGGTADEENSYHWGVYTSMTIDPVDDCTFWYVNEYFDANQVGSEVNWQTRISHFALPNCN
ncbi:MAG TPA: hypothetical protein VKR57_02975 [Terriglobales bacterium]|nr:hypothetical protein [Terriglobales bacterium]